MPPKITCGQQYGSSGSDRLFITGCYGNENALLTEAERAAFASNDFVGTKYTYGNEDGHFFESGYNFFYSREF